MPLRCWQVRAAHGNAQFDNPFTTGSLNRDHRDPKNSSHFGRIDSQAPALDDVHHIQRHNHRQPKVKDLGQ